MITAFHQLQRLLARAASPSPFASGIGIRLRQADEAHKLMNDGKSQAADESFESRDPLMGLDKEYVSRCDDDGYGGIIYGKDNTDKDEEENTPRNNNNNNLASTDGTGN